ncbi:HAD family hydrolase [Clostridium vincentii]|uniref:Phosphorylated carbohydrates phosphatase n=1 Tax=Clostridium vincentii TaxID=52704 RepID=A0A2T0BJP9_9CLOT|nr:HAD family phosphatase [Clostridium vincentii]PRR84053.1 Phosphorylated carbohydrates phosphatase [Clostridium vincentii]
MNNIKLVIFDMDGLMLDSEIIAWKAWDAVKKNYNCDFNFEFYRNFIGTTEASISSIMLETYGSDFPIKDFLNDAKKEKARIVSVEGIAVKKGLVDLLDYLTKAGIKKAVATSSHRNVMENLLSLSNVLHYFDYSVCGDEIENGKPSPDVFLKALDNAGAKTTEAFVLEDSINGILAAHNANIPVIFIQDLVEAPVDTLGLVYKKMNDLSEVISVFEK